MGKIVMRRPVGREGQPVMVERVARAIRKASYGSETGWIFELSEAYAAIEARREPTKPMVDKAWSMISSNLRYEEVYRHLIDAALEQPHPAVVDPA